MSDNTVAITEKMTLQNVSKKYGNKTALDKISLNIRNGEILGYIGPNGAGKSTTLRIIAGLDSDFEGALQFDGKPLHISDEYLSKIGYMPQSISFAPWRTVGETIELFGRLSGFNGTRLDDRVNQIMEFVGLISVLPLRCTALSGGMSQRLNLAQALLHEPDLVILDEPFNQLDPIGRAQLKKMILTLKSKGVTVLFSSHILSDVEELADRVAIINKSELLFQGDINELCKLAIKEITFIISLIEPVEIFKWINLFDIIVSITEIKFCQYKIKIKPELSLRYEQIASLFLETTVLNGIKVKEFKIIGHSLDEMFNNMLGENHE